MASNDYRRLHNNEELIDLFFTQEDRLPRAAIDEAIRRGTEIVPFLSEVVMDRVLWNAELPEWWAPVHATYALGAIGGQEVLIPLLAAIRWSDAYDNEWVTEDLPSILGSLGEISYNSLVAVVSDRSAGWSARSIAMDALGSQAMRFPQREEGVMSVLGHILRDHSEEHGARRSAAFVLLDFRRADYRKELISLAEAERRWQQQYSDYRAAFTPEDVQRDLTSPRIGMDVYIRDWLEFYEPAEIAKRQERWAIEDGRPRPELSPAPRTMRGAVMIGRNDPCPCGSGKPYKRCCWNKLH
ncbi:MAG: SEC-C domain-containing protein [bacterium]